MGELVANFERTCRTFDSATSTLRGKRSTCQLLGSPDIPGIPGIPEILGILEIPELPELLGIPELPEIPEICG